MDIKFIKRLKKLITQYQTRKQLISLPTHLLKDIAVTPEQVTIEARKNTVIISLRSLIKSD